MADRGGGGLQSLGAGASGRNEGACVHTANKEFAIMLRRGLPQKKRKRVPEVWTDKRCPSGGVTNGKRHTGMTLSSD